MPIATLLLSLAMQVTDPSEITVTGRPWAPFISPMGEPFRPRNVNEDPLVTWFTQADVDRDGILTTEEMTADAERFFAELDVDKNDAIHPEEFVAYEWEVAPEIQVDSRWRRERGEEPDENHESRRKTRLHYESYVRQGAGRYALLNIPQPVAAADTDFDRAVSTDEFRRAAAYRFQLLDKAGAGRLTLSGLHALVPTPQEAKRRKKRGDNVRDERVATPVPLDD